MLGWHAWGLGLQHMLHDQWSGSAPVSVMPTELFFGSSWGK
jgi:hypothetical protein